MLHTWTVESPGSYLNLKSKGSGLLQAKDSFWELLRDKSETSFVLSTFPDLEMA